MSKLTEWVKAQNKKVVEKGQMAAFKAVWPALRPKVETWIRTRAVQLPLEQRTALYKKGITEEVIAETEKAIEDWAIRGLDNILDDL
jgi:predicted component of type VI protein secretion system